MSSSCGAVLTAADQIDDPQTLTGLFPPDSDDEDDVDVDVSHNRDTTTTTTKTGSYHEIQSINLINEIIKIRQYDYHSHNANRIWPGTFPLAEYLLATNPVSAFTPTTTETMANGEVPVPIETEYKHNWGRILELGTATGLLAIRLSMACSSSYSNRNTVGDTKVSNHQFCCTNIVTSDVEDEYGDIAMNLQYNYQLNNIALPYPYHIPHSWGTGWHNSVKKVITSTSTNDESNSDHHPLFLPFDTIIASDILLYVSAYPALVQTLSELMIPSRNDEQQHEEELDQPSNKKKPIQFIMSWNRRLKESHEFFTRMKDAGFVYEQHGKGLYTFTYDGSQVK